MGLSLLEDFSVFRKRKRKFRGLFSEKAVMKSFGIKNDHFNAKRKRFKSREKLIPITCQKSPSPDLNQHDEKCDILNRTSFRMFSESKRIRLDSTKSNSDLGFYILSLIGKIENTINVYQRIKF